MTLNARLVGRILSIQKILVEGIEKTPEGAVADGKVTPYMLIRGSTGNDVLVDSNGNLVCMLKGSENLPIAQDSGGNMVAVMKGEYSGVLDTIAVDDQGRMLSIITDPEDIWGKAHHVGLSEAVARIGSQMSFDRRGTIFAYDNFNDSPLKWRKTIGADSTGSVTLSNEQPINGEGCMRITGPTTVGQYCRAWRVYGGTVMHRMGMEMNIYFGNTINCKTSISLSAWNGTRFIHAGIRLQQAGSGGLSYLTANTPYQDASWTSFNTDFSIGVGVSYPLKFVFDIDTEKYVRCMFGGVEMDMSAYTPYAADSSSCQYVVPNVYTVTSAVPTVYFDNFIITTQEPA